MNIKALRRPNHVGRTTSQLTYAPRASVTRRSNREHAPDEQRRPHKRDRSRPQWLDGFTSRLQQPRTYERGFVEVLSWNEFLLRLGAAVPGGALIGFERQWRSRGAGLRTNTLVAAGAAMFVLIAQMTPRQTGYDPTRITSYVVSGVGFLGAGVIISDGARVRGINTAATLWCAAAVRALLLQSISGHGYQLRALESADIDGTDLVEVRAELATVGRNDEQTKRPPAVLASSLTSLRSAGMSSNATASELSAPTTRATAENMAEIPSIVEVSL
jgi:hypothetical protein